MLCAQNSNIVACKNILCTVLVCVMLLHDGDMLGSFTPESQILGLCTLLPYYDDVRGIGDSALLS